MEGKMRAIKGTPEWQPVVRIQGSDIGLTHTQDVFFTSGGIEYGATFCRFYNKHLPQGERTSYDVDVIRHSTGRRSRVLSDMMQASGWLSTFKLNVREWAERLADIPPSVPGIPPHTAPIYGENGKVSNYGDVPLWSGAGAPPAIGTEVVCQGRNRERVRVTGYEVASGWLMVTGVRLRDGVAGNLAGAEILYSDGSK